MNQNFRSVLIDDFELAEKYYAILSAINGLQLTNREIQLVAFTAVKGNISNANVREEFCRKYNTTSATINNIISKLKKMGIFIKEKGKVKIIPLIVMDFSKELILQIKLTHEGK
jgi:DNA-binding MarR family transcriptional regulator